MTASALLRHDIQYMTELVDGLSRWLREREIASLDAMRGMMSWSRGQDRGIYTRANYLRILEHYVSS
jgi:dihydroorotate dehydrogenase (fumarate)